MQLGVVAHMAAGDHQMGKAQDVLPAVPAVKAQQHIAANGKVQLCPGIFPGQFFHREHRIVAVSGSGLLDLPAADFQLRDTSASSSSAWKQLHISSRSAPGAEVFCLKGESPAGITTTLSGCTRAAAARRLFRWPLWGGSNVPP